MPYVQPGRGDVHVNGPLTNLSVAFIQSASHFVATQAFPTISVDKQSDKYFTYDRGAWNRDEMQERAPATESAGGTYTVDSSPSYQCVEYGYHKDVPDQVRMNADTPLNPDREATEFVAMKALLKREITWAAKYFVGSTWTNNRAGVSGTPTSGTEVKQWNDPASTPIEDVRDAATTVGESTGFRPNVLVLGRRVYDKLVDHPDIIGRLDRGQTTGPAKANLDALAALFEVGKVLVMDAIRNTAKEGQTAAHSFIGGKRALLVYAAPSPGLMTPSGGYTFTWKGMYGGDNAAGARISKFRMQHLKADRVEGEFAYDQKLVSADLGYFYDTVVA